MRIVLVVLVWLLWTLPSWAQAIEDAGTYLVGYRDVTFVDQNFGRGQIKGRIYYPALSAGLNAAPQPGPYPLTAFQHGYTGAPSDYDLLNTHTASWGFVVASIGTQTGIQATMQNEARDTRALLYWVDDQKDDPTSFLYQMSGDGPWGAAGHSMGGGALLYLIEYEPRVRTIVPLQSYRGPLLGGSRGANQNISAFTGAAFFVAGSVDTTVPASSVRAYFQGAALAQRNFYALVNGMGHGGPTDSTTNNEPLPAPDQQRLHRRFVTGFLRAELLGEQNLYADLVGERLQPDPVQVQSRGLAPVLWVAPSLTPGNFVLGVAGQPAQGSQLLFSLATNSAPPGTLGLDLTQGAILQSGTLNSNGITETRFDWTSYLSGTPLYFQGFTGTYTRVEATTAP